MRKNPYLHRQTAELFYSLVILALLLFFTYGIFGKAPYLGFYFNPTDRRILQIFTPSESLWKDILLYSFSPGVPSPTDDISEMLQVGDILLRVGDVSLENNDENRRQNPFNDLKDGERVYITVDRKGREITVLWKIPGFNLVEFFSRFFNVWWLAYIFWLLGFTAQAFVRPKDTRRLLLIAFNYLTSLWVILGALSARRIWDSSILLHAVTWCMLPVYLHFHWLFPKPLGTAPKPVIILLYAASILLALGELFQIFPKSLYAVGFLFSLIGSVVLQIIHFISHPEQRREVGFIAFAILLVILPSVALSISGITGIIPQISVFGLLTLPFMPLAYLFVIYRGQLGGLEMRANRFISLYSFLIILGTVIIIMITPIMSLELPGNIPLLLSWGTAILTALISILLFPVFQAFMEKKALGIKLPYQNLQETYSSRITTSASLPSLLQLLEEEVLPSLLVREFVFLRVLTGELKILLAKNVDVERVSHKCMLDELTQQAGKVFPADFPCDWVRLILPLKVGDRLIGFWLLGKRDPDDYYPQAEIPILQAIANQTAVALSNIEHAEQLRRIYQTDIERHEKERMNLALELHDNVLNGLAVLRTNLDDASLPPRIQTSYEEVTRRLREIVSDLRPPMLMYGLVPAVNALADNLMERSGDRVTIQVDIQEGGERLPQNIERHLFRIVQEACENSLRHAQAATILITGILTPRRVELNITDDGVGFDPQTELSSLIANSHFGLAGMVERANLIGAEINIQSEKNSGTMIRVTWTGETENG